ncbi:MAG: hypothetical protein GF364_17420 [Candidatus Lokiarchaeota archaeon]|nr:hypothetical protein [Candidatus Lokiarchaeota archaeon]
MEKDYTEKIKQMNEELKNDRKEFETLQGYETILEALVYKIYDLFGKNALLSMTYQIGVGPGEELAANLLEMREGKKFKDPLKALTFVLKRHKEYYNVKILEINEEEVEIKNQKYNKIIVKQQNKCFFRNSLKKKSRLRIGGPLCRINKGYYEKVFSEITGYKCEIGFIRDDKDNDVCIESIVFYVPKSYI